MCIDRALGFTAIRALSGQGGPSGTVRPAPPIRDHKRERAKRPPRRATRADSGTPPVNENARLDFEAGLEATRFAAPWADSQFVEGPHPLVQSVNALAVWLFVGSRHGPRPLQLAQFPPQSAFSMKTVPFPHLQRQPCL
jgi:hypothetical protein